jgi:hypothetical protein
MFGRSERRMRSVAEEIAHIYALGHRNVLDAVHELDEDQMRWRPPRTNSIAFNLWHIARWADHMQWVVGSLTPGLRERDEDASAELPLPAKDDLLAYATRTVANWILGGIRHDSRHLGMIEALKGAMGMRGTATE